MSREQGIREHLWPNVSRHTHYRAPGKASLDPAASRARSTPAGHLPPTSLRTEAAALTRANPVLDLAIRRVIPCIDAPTIPAVIFSEAKTPDDRPDVAAHNTVAAVIPNWNQSEMTIRCVSRVRTQVDHIYIVDNNSRPNDRAKLFDVANSDTTILINPTNGGYAAGCNLGVAAAVEAGFSAVLIMNNDAFPDPGSIGPLLARLEQAPHVAAVGPVVVRYGTREVLHAACSLSLRAGHGRWLEYGASLEALDRAPVPTGYLSGEAMLIRSEAVQMLDMFDERYFCYNEDADWSVRAKRAGWALEVVPESVFEHIVSVTSAGWVGTYYRARNIPLFLRLAGRRKRLTALILAVPAEAVSFAALIRHGHISLAFRGVVVGWLTGATMRL